MSELSKLYACLRISQDDESDEEVEFWLKEIEKEKAKDTQRQESGKGDTDG